MSHANEINALESALRERPQAARQISPCAPTDFAGQEDVTCR